MSKKRGRPKGGGKRKSWVFGKKMVKCQFCHKYIRTNPSLTMYKGRYAHKGCVRRKTGRRWTGTRFVKTRR